MTLLDPMCGDQRKVQVLNVSKDGLKLGVMEPLDPGSIVQIRMKDGTAMAEVRYCVRVDQGFHAGVHLQETFH